MGYDTDELLELSLKAIEENNCLFIDDIIAFLPCSRATFYNHGLDKLDDIKEGIWKNRAAARHKQNQRWAVSGNATLEVSLRKLIGTPEERRTLSQSYQDITSDGERLGSQIPLEDLTIEELEVLKKLHAKRSTRIAAAGED